MVRFYFRFLLCNHFAIKGSRDHAGSSFTRYALGRLRSFYQKSSQPRSQLAQGSPRLWEPQAGTIRKAAQPAAQSSVKGVARQQRCLLSFFISRTSIEIFRRCPVFSFSAGSFLHGLLCGLHLFGQGCGQSPSPPKAVSFPCKRRTGALSFSGREIGFALKQGAFLRTPYRQNKSGRWAEKCKTSEF